MKIPIIFVILVVTYCMAAGDFQKKPTSKESAEINQSEEAGPPPSGFPPSGPPTSEPLPAGPPPAGSPPPRPRRSPPRFDANQMKGKYAKSNKLIGLIPYFGMERTSRQKRSVADYLSPTSALIYAVQPPVKQKTPEVSPSA